MAAHARSPLQPPAALGWPHPALDSSQPLLDDPMCVDSSPGEEQLPAGAKRQWSQPFEVQQEQGEEARKRVRQPQLVACDPRPLAAAFPAQQLQQLQQALLPPPAHLQLPPLNDATSSQPSSQPVSAPPRQQEPQGPGTLSVLTWNVWKNDVYTEQRMAAISDIISQHEAGFVCLQEVTPHSYQLLSGAAWWQRYHASNCPEGPGSEYFTVLLWHRDTVQNAPQWVMEMPFRNSIMGRDLKTIAGTVCGRPVRVATAHLESHMGSDPSGSTWQAHLKQCQQAAALLAPPMHGAGPQDVLFAGDMNWAAADDADGKLPLPGGPWFDAWWELHHKEGNHTGEPGCTWDTTRNLMLGGKQSLQRRLDRVFCRLQHWRISSTKLLGREALPPDPALGPLLFNNKYPVFPSDHFGLLLTLTSA